MKKKKEVGHKVGDLKETNPKDAIAGSKVPLHLFPKSAVVGGALALLEGMLKYGRSNWRHAGVKASVYVDAAERHLARWFEGEDEASDSGLSHLYHAIACLAILIDAEEAGKLVDDRQYPGGDLSGRIADEEETVRRLKDKYSDRSPKHWTIRDA